MKHVKTFRAYNLSEVEGLVNSFVRESNCELIHARLVRVSSCSSYDAFILFKQKAK